MAHCTCGVKTRRKFFLEANRLTIIFEDLCLKSVYFVITVLVLVIAFISKVI